LRILFVAGVPGNPEAGGAPTAIRQLGAALEKLGHRVDYVFAEDFPPAARRAPWCTFALPLLLPAKLAGRSYDVMDLTSGDGVLFLALRRWGLAGGAAVVVRSHGSEHEFADVMRRASAQGMLRLSPWFRARFYGVRLRQVEQSLRRCDRVICCTEREAGYLGERLGLARSKVSVIAHGVSEEFIAAGQLDLPKQDKVIFVGNWVWNKGIRHLPAVFAGLRERHQQLRMVLAGTHVAAEEVGRDFPEAVRPFLEIYPTLPPKELARLVAQARLMLFPSDYEGFGLVALEAMAAGTPVVLPRSVGLVEWVNGDEVLTLASPGTSGYRAACEALLADSARSAALAARARAWALPWTWETAARRTIEAYQQARQARMN